MRVEGAVLRGVGVHCGGWSSGLCGISCGISGFCVGKRCLLVGGRAVAHVGEGVAVVAGLGKEKTTVASAALRTQMDDECVGECAGGGRCNCTERRFAGRWPRGQTLAGKGCARWMSIS